MNIEAPSARAISRSVWITEWRQCWLDLEPRRKGDSIPLLNPMSKIGLGSVGSAATSRPWKLGLLIPKAAERIFEGETISRSAPLLPTFHEQFVRLLQRARLRDFLT